MSVDLVGSTSFKAHKDYSSPDDGRPSPRWVDEFRTFYKEFPIEMDKAYGQLVNASSTEQSYISNRCPNVWKRIGDEIIFCGRVNNIEHTAMCVSAFIKALECYTLRLENDNKPLRVKGAGWLAAFPAPNVSIAISPELIIKDQGGETIPSENDEAFEKVADEKPSQFDFLGKGIDTGFRIAKNASEDRFVVSVQLGYVLTQAAESKKFQHSFGYHGREVLKGVINGVPYPIISVDAESSQPKSELKKREAKLTGETKAESLDLRDFLKAFMEMADIEAPCLAANGTAWSDEWPESYQSYQRSFDENLKIDNENIQQVTETDDPPVPDDGSLGPSEDFLNNMAPS